MINCFFFAVNLHTKVNCCILQQLCKMCIRDSTLTGAIINTILDPTLIFGFHMGIAGAAWATVIGQVVSGIMVILYLRKFKTVKLTKEKLSLIHILL